MPSGTGLGTPGWESLVYCMSGLVWEAWGCDMRRDIQAHPTHFKPVPTLYFRFSKEIVDSSPTSFFLFSPTKRAATCAGRTFSKRRRFRFSHSSTSSLSARFLFFNRKSWRQQYSFWEEEREDRARIGIILCPDSMALYVCGMRCVPGGIWAAW